MNRPLFAALLALGSSGILIAFWRARPRAVLEADGLSTPGRRAAASVLLAAVLLVTVALPFAAGLAGAEPDTKDLSLVSLFAVHVILIVFLAAYYLLAGRPPAAAFLKLASPRPAADLSAGLLIGLFGWVLTVLAAAVAIGIWLALRGREAGLPAPSGAAPTILWIVSRPLWARIGILASARSRRR